MGQIETQVGNQKSPFLQKHSASIRIWHWLLFATISFLIITVIFEETMFSPWDNVSIVQNVLKTKNAVVTDDQAKAVAHEYGDKLWDLHKYLGFVLIFLFLARIVIEVSLSQEEKMRTRIKNALFMSRQNSPDKKLAKHYLIVKYSYSVFYLLVLYLAVTGSLLAFGHQLGLSRPTHHTIKEMHGFGQYLMYAFIFFHLCGVVLADMKHSRGIVSGMVNGGE